LEVHVARNNLRHLRKVELIEMLLTQTKRVEDLEKEVSELKARLEDRQILLNETGDLATASLQINGFFEAAQRAADQYIENARQLSERRLFEAEQIAMGIIQQSTENKEGSKEGRPQQ
jgi:hypothetical protein